jgi:hypothetical protein
MSNYSVTDEQFISCWNEMGSPTLVAQKLKMAVRSVHHRRRSIEFKYQMDLVLTNPQRTGPQIPKIEQVEGNVRRGINIEKGRVIVFSDAHFQPNEVTTAYKALLLMLKEFKGEIKAIVANGDIFDGSQASRHPRINWSQTPTVKEELEACQEFMGGIEKLAGNAELIWTLGNHDARFETFLSNAGITTYEGVLGFSLKDHFPLWKSCWSFWVNEDTCIKHRWKGGFGATRSNSLNSGTNMITGHTHNLSAFPITDYNGTRWGVQTGCLADPHSSAFIHYIEDAPTDWRSGFVLLSWENSKMLMPELVMVSGEDEFEFRGCVNRI